MRGSKENHRETVTHRELSTKASKWWGKNTARWTGSPQLASKAVTGQPCSGRPFRRHWRGPAPAAPCPAGLCEDHSLRLEYPLHIEFPLLPQSLWQTLAQSAPTPRILLRFLGLPSSLTGRNPRASLPFGPSVPKAPRLQFSEAALSHSPPQGALRITW